MVFFTESMFGMPSPVAVRPLEPSGAIVKCVAGFSCEVECASAGVATTMPLTMTARARRDAETGLTRMDHLFSRQRGRPPNGGLRERNPRMFRAGNIRGKKFW